jgi:hypothetical protein
VRRDPDCVGLMPMEPERFARICRRILHTKDATAFVVKQALFDKLIDGVPWLEARVKLNEGVGPQQASGDLVTDLALNARVTDMDEAVHK